MYLLYRSLQCICIVWQKFIGFTFGARENFIWSVNFFINYSENTDKINLDVVPSFKNFPTQSEILWDFFDLAQEHDDKPTNIIRTFVSMQLWCQRCEISLDDEIVQFEAVLTQFLHNDGLRHLFHWSSETKLIWVEMLNKNYLHDNSQYD